MSKNRRTKKIKNKNPEYGEAFNKFFNSPSVDDEARREFMGVVRSPELYYLKTVLKILENEELKNKIKN